MSLLFWAWSDELEGSGFRVLERASQRDQSQAGLATLAPWGFRFLSSRFRSRAPRQP